MYNAVVLAGGSNNRKLRELQDVPYEAMIDIKGRPMVSYVVDALKSSPSIGTVVVVGPSKELKEILSAEGITCIEQGSDLMENLVLALKQVEGEKVLVVACDIPFLTSIAVEDFLARCLEREADFYYPIVRKEDNEAKFPGVKRTYVKLREGVFTGGNLFLLSPVIFEGKEDFGRRVMALRKNPLKLAKLLGLGFALNFLLKRLSLSEVEKKVWEVFNLKGSAVISPYPEISVDIDRKSDLELIHSI
jgi:GTP:adenosylcobinamide-phosphate guanylyltransferase